MELHPCVSGMCRPRLKRNMQAAHKVEAPRINGQLGRVREWFSSVGSNPSFAYLSILALQFKVIWGIWERKD